MFVGQGTYLFFLFIKARWVFVGTLFLWYCHLDYTRWQWEYFWGKFDRLTFQFGELGEDGDCVI